MCLDEERTDLNKNRPWLKPTHFETDEGRLGGACAHLWAEPLTFTGRRDTGWVFSGRWSSEKPAAGYWTVQGRTLSGISSHSSAADPEIGRLHWACHDGTNRPASGPQPGTQRPGRRRRGRRTSWEQNWTGRSRGGGRRSGRRLVGGMWAVASENRCFLTGCGRVEPRTAAPETGRSRAEQMIWLIWYMF